MVRQIQVTVPRARTERVKEELISTNGVHNITVFHGEETSMLVMREKEKKVGRIMNTLEDLGVGVNYGIVDIVQLQTTRPRLGGSKTKKKKYRIDDSLSMEEIYDSIDSQIHLTFDYIALTLVAAMIAAAGLLSDSSVVVVASMLVSPLMGPILGITLGFMTGDKHIRNLSMRNEIVAVLLTFLVGCVSALIVSPFTMPRTNEMESRGVPMALLWGIFVAAPSGAGVALSIANGGINALVGVAISASLLPPVVNCGLNFTLAIVSNYYGRGIPEDHFQWAMYSILLFTLNVFLILVVSMCVFKMKKIKRSTKRRTSLFMDLEEASHNVPDVQRNLLD